MKIWIKKYFEEFSVNLMIFENQKITLRGTIGRIVYSFLFYLFVYRFWGRILEGFGKSLESKNMRRKQFEVLEVRSPP